MKTLQNIIESAKKDLTREYRKVYEGILSDEILDKSYPWYESFLESFANRIVAEIEGMVPRHIEIEDHHERVYLNCPRCCEVLGHNACLSHLETALSAFKKRG